MKLDRKPPKVQFEDIAAQAGLRFHHVSGNAVEKKFLVEGTGSGVALLDFDNDGLLDIFLVNGTRWHEPSAGGSRLFRNLGGLRFEDVTARSGILKHGWGQGVCAGDYDNDGYVDLFVTYYGKNALYHNQGDGTFRDVTREAGIEFEETRWSTGCAFLDYDRDGRLDLAIANYAKLDPATTPKPGADPLCGYKGLPVMCGPRGLERGRHLLFRNAGGGKFADVSRSSGFEKPAGCYGFSVLTGDFDNDGWPDVYIACDSTPSILYRNNRDGTFTDVGVSSGAAFNQDGEEQAGMGAAAADYLHSGSLHIVKTNFAGDTPTLYRNDGKGFFTDVTMRAGLAVHTNFLGWGVGFPDVDNDGWKDIFMVNGHVYPSVDKLRDGSPFRQAKNLYWNAGNGTFADISAQSGPGVTEPRCGRGAAVGDLNNDGSLEIAINNLDSSPSLLVNRAPRLNWVILKLRGVQSNRDAIGARVTLTAGGVDQMDEVRSGGSYLSQSDFRLHFGVGAAKHLEGIRVRWPNGVNESFAIREVNREYSIEEGRSQSK